MPRALIIVNPAAGRGRAASAAGAVEDALLGAGWSVDRATTRRPADEEELARTREGYDLLLPTGGDGTLHEAINAATRGGAPCPDLAPVPAGSGNSLALDLGVRTPEDAAERVLSGARRGLDAIRVTLDGGRSLVSINVVGWGAASRISARADRFRWARGARYDVASAAELLLPRIPPANARVDGEEDTSQLLGIASITQHSGRGMRVAPEALLDDGAFDVVTIRRGFRPRLMAMLASVQSGGHARSGLVRFRRATELDLELLNDAGLVIDGEHVRARTAKLEIVPGFASLRA